MPGIVAGERKLVRAMPDVEPPLKFPYSVVWTPIPIVTWMLPVVGHMGICSSDGTIHDFAGPYFVNTGAMAFGSPTRYWQLDPAEAAGLVTATQTTDIRAHADAWDAALQATKRTFQQRPYYFFTSNCHSFVGHMLSEIRYGSCARWHMVAVAAEVLWRGTFVGVSGFLRTWGPAAALVAIALVAFGIAWSAAWLALVLVATAVLFLAKHLLRRDVPAVYRAATV